MRETEFRDYQGAFPNGIWERGATDRRPACGGYLEVRGSLDFGQLGGGADDGDVEAFVVDE